MKKAILPKLLLSSAMIGLLGLTDIQTKGIPKKQQHQKSDSNKSSQPGELEAGFVMGKAKYSNCTLTKVHTFGKTRLDHVIVKGNTKVFGRCKVKDSHLNKLKIHGKTNMADTSIQGPAQILGKAIIANSQLNRLKVCGKLVITKSTVKGRLNVVGALQAADTDFEDPVKVIGNVKALQTRFKNNIFTVAREIVFHDVIAQDLHIKNNQHELAIWGKKYKFLSFVFHQQKEQPTIVTLSGKTVIHGSITFENEDSVVLLGDEARIEGKVVNGQIKRLEESPHQ